VLGIINHGCSMLAFPRSDATNIPIPEQERGSLGAMVFLSCLLMVVPAGTLNHPDLADHCCLEWCSPYARVISLRTRGVKHLAMRAFASGE
jgi:hypothetical protein